MVIFVCLNSETTSTKFHKQRQESIYKTEQLMQWNSRMTWCRYAIGNMYLQYLYGDKIGFAISLPRYGIKN